jgi:hypothetical protein
MATHVQELDKLIDRVQDLQVEASEDGFDAAATTLDEVIETLRGIDFNDGEDESAEGAEPED